MEACFLSVWLKESKNKGEVGKRRKRRREVRKAATEKLEGERECEGGDRYKNGNSFYLFSLLSFFLYFLSLLFLKEK